MSKKQVIFCALKLVGGLVAVIAALLSGTFFGGCPPNIFCGARFSVFAMQFDYWSIGAVVIGIGLLLSALRDVLASSKAPESIEQNIESVAHRQNDDLDIYFGGPDT